MGGEYGCEVGSKVMEWGRGLCLWPSGHLSFIKLLLITYFDIQLIRVHFTCFLHYIVQ